jgi:secreted trypsin-like serine protease
MRLSRLSCLLAGTAALVVALSATPAAVAAEPDPAVTPTLVGGVDATEPYSFMASMQSTRGSHRCGASLITPTWVVTAAHCVAGTSPSSLQFRIGSNDRTSGGTVVRARRIVSHRSSDLALVQLAATVPAEPVAIAGEDPTGSDTRLLGWGQTCPTRGCGGVPVQLQQLDTTVLPDSRCRGIRGRTELCISNVSGWRGACYGDSGGPAIILADDRWLLVGATSRGTASRCGVSPAIYVDVTAHVSWISGIVGG